MTTIGVSGYPEIKHSDEKRICAEIWKVFARCTPHDATAPYFTGVSCLYPGADTLFARQVLAEDGRLEVVIPGAGYGTVLHQMAGHNGWLLYHELLDEASKITVLDCTPHNNRYLKAAMAVAWQSDVLVAIWDHMGETHSPTARVVDKFTRVLNRVVYSIDISSS